MNILPEVQKQVDRPFPVKLAETKDVIARHFEEFGDKVVVAFSGGKDSEAVLWLCLQVNPDVAVVFNNTGVEYPETMRFVAMLEEQWSLNLVVTHPEKTFWQCVEQYGFAQGTKRKGIKFKGNRPYCCYWLKEKPMIAGMRQHGWLGYFTGETAVESFNRMMWAQKKGTCIHLKKEGVCKIKPILWWTQEEVWAFIRSNGLPVNEAYTKGARRVGCLPCTAYKDWEAQMQKAFPKLYKMIKLRKDKQYMMELL